MKINIFANTMIEEGMSGGNRIFIEYSKRWIKKGVKIRIFTSDAGRDLCLLNNLTKADFVIWNLPYKKEKFNTLELLLFYFFGLVMGSINALKFSFSKEKEIIYSSSDYWPDSLPALLMKLKNFKNPWVAGFFLFAPKPWEKDSPYKGKRRLTGFLYWLMQLPVYLAVKKFSQMVFVTSEPDVIKFLTKKRGKDKVLVIRGGVDIKLSNKVKEPKNKLYDAVFIGRFHPQKGVMELVDIWMKVVEVNHKAKLVMIGNGPLLAEVRSKICQYHLEKNIDLLGFLDGIPKIKIFKACKIVVHPAIYDSGGMAACEAMAAGLPGVCFDLEALKTYYPKGMIKTPCFDFEGFAENILKLLEDKKLYKTIRKEAVEWAREWDWDCRAKFIYSKLNGLIYDLH